MPTVTRLTSNGVFQSSGGFDEVSLNSGSIRFNGSTNYLSVPSSDAFAFGTGDYTMECWVYSQAGGDKGIFQQGTSLFPASTTNTVALGMNASNTWQIYAKNTNTNSTATRDLNAWYHAALVRYSGTTTLYINGVAVITVASDTTNYTGTYFGIGGIYGNYYFPGYISNVRIVKGTALYTTNFTPPTAPLLPVSNTSLLLSTNSQNPFKDSSVNNFAITKVSNPTFNTLGPFYFPANTSINLANTNNNPVLGSNTNIITSTTSNGVVIISNGFDEVSMSSGSLKFNGTTDYLTIAQTTNLDLPADFTLEAWVYPQTTAQTGIGGKWGGPGSVAYVLAIDPVNNQLRFGTGNSGTFVATYDFVTTSIPINTWHHVAITRSGSSVRAFLNGTQIGSTTTVTSNLTASTTCFVGSVTTVDNLMNGYISNFRLLKGTALYTSNFIPPQTALLPVANTSLLLNNFAAEPFVDNSPNNFTLTRNGTPSANTLSPFANTQQKVLNTGTMMVKEFDEWTITIVGVPVVDSSLKLWLDAGQTASYPGSGTTWTDLSGNGNNGTLTNGPTYTSSNGGSLVFDGTNDYVTLGSSLSGTLAGTISFWIKLTNTITTGYAGNQRPWGKNGDFECRWGGNSDIRDQSLVTDIGGILSLVSVQNTWLNTVWYNITIVYNGATNSSALYVQGVLDAIGTAGNVTGLTGNWNIGATSSTAGPLNGQISQYLIYNRALSAAEVQQNFNALRGRYGI